jgi:hypothetical protein
VRHPLRSALPVAFVAGCAAGPQHLDAPKAVFNVELAPYASHEDCLALRAGDRFGYVFEARVPVAFNIHFREGAAVIAPISRDSTSAESGDFTPDQDQTYCLTWQAGPEGSSVDYRLRPFYGGQ